ncbi:MAG TPA: hypothetical protein VEI97_02835, partial [bacterium]|nr:hypothetical protein [bacterium]
KVGVCVFDSDGNVLARKVIPKAALESLLAAHPGIPLAVGRGTGRLPLPASRPVYPVDETGTTHEGREAWRRAHPVLRILELFGYAPASDGYAAEVIGRRFLAMRAQTP